MTPRRVAVTGLGGVFPTCSGLEDFAGKLFANRSLIREWPEVLRYGKQVRSQVSGFVTLEEAGLEQVDSPIIPGYPDFYRDTLNRIPPENLATADVGAIWSMLAARDAVAMAGLTEREVQSERTGVIVGSGAGGNAVLRPAWEAFFQKGKKTRHIGSHNVDRAMIYKDAANVSCYLRTQGICESIGSACACGLGNIGYAARAIAFGLQDRVVAGGTEGTSIESFLGFDAMTVLSRGFAPEASSRPFDKQRNGFVCSFGCGVVVLEELAMARARGARVLAILDSYFNNSDGDGDMFSPSMDGQVRLWQGLQAGATWRGRPDVVKVHGTSTPMGDTIELNSIVQVLGDQGYVVCAPKSQFGHMLGAAGAVEFVAGVLMLRDQQTTPCLNAEELSEELEPFQQEPDYTGPRQPLAAYRHLLPLRSERRPIGSVVCLNYGFGGTNAAALLVRPEAEE